MGFLSKGVALTLVVASLQLVVGLAALAAQLGQGFFDIDWALYATQLLGFGFPQAMLLAALALTVQTVLRHKYLAHGVMVGTLVLRPALGLFGVEEPLLRYGAEPGISYSDLNGWGHWLAPALTFRAWWSAVAVLLLVLAWAQVQRGRERQPFAGLLARVPTPGRWLGALALVAAAVVGSILVYRTRIAQPYLTARDREARQADYEKRWKPWAERPSPRIVDSEVRFDVFPHESPPRLEASGRWTFENKTDAPIDAVLVNFDESAQLLRLEVAGNARPLEGALASGTAAFPLDPPLAPGARQTLDFTMRLSRDGFRHGPRGTDVVGNGTFFNNFALPMLGYVDVYELVEDGTRRKYGLEPKERMADRDDARGLQRNYLRGDSDFVGFRATVSTSADQLGIAPGTLVKAWREGERRFFRYELDQPILNFFSVLSARYVIDEDSWEGVTLQIFRDAKHPWNTARMMAGMKDALAWCSAAFGPYQHRQARIIEFPRYQSFAQSFPNTIPYSEGLGFIARVRDDDASDLDYPYYVTAHEIAHQWWAHQVVGGNVQGATMTSETMAQYSALMVMKHRYGPDKMRRFLKHELDSYLFGRATERKKELPLSRVENQQYLHYNKGSLAMYWLQDVVGEDTVNRALRKYVEAVRFRGPPYTNSTELLGYLRAEVGEAHQALITDLFERIVLYDNRATRAVATRAAGGGYEVTVELTAVKYVAGPDGAQTPVDFGELMEVGGLDAEGRGLCLEKQRIQQDTGTLRFHCDVLPARAGVDPLNKLIDRTSDDNVTSVTEE